MNEDLKKIIQIFYKEDIDFVLNNKQYYFEEEENEENIIYNKENESVKKLFLNLKKIIIQGATIYKLLEKLTNQEYSYVIEKKYIEIFMLTYRSFITSQELFNLIMLRFDVPPVGVNSKEEFQLFKVSKLMPIRFFLNFLKQLL
jgi:hypothetical protein